MLPLIWKHLLFRLDTRAARWLLALVGVSTVAMMLVPVLAPTTFDQTYAGYLRVAALGLTILLPVVAILLVTGEWSQRSVMTTFTQVPRRLRVLNAKLAVSLLLGGAGAAFGAVVAAGAAGLASASGRSLEAVGASLTSASGEEEGIDSIEMTTLVRPRARPPRSSTRTTARSSA